MPCTTHKNLSICKSYSWERKKKPHYWVRPVVQSNSGLIACYMLCCDTLFTSCIQIHILPTTIVLNRSLCCVKITLMMFYYFNRALRSTWLKQANPSKSRQSAPTWSAWEVDAWAQPSLYYHCWKVTTLMCVCVCVWFWEYICVFGWQLGSQLEN